jgi:O-antigen/teichoic acid export membrane protein
MDQGADGATEVSLEHQRTQEVSGGMLHASRGFIGNAGITLIGAGTGALLTMGTDVLAARFLGVSTYGLYALALMLAKCGEIIAEFGVPLSLLHFLPVSLSRGDRGSALGAILGSLLLPIAIGLGFAFALWFRADWVASHLLGQPAAGPFIAVLGFAIPLMVTIDVLGNVARGFGRALPYVVTYNIVPQLCAAAVFISLMIWEGPQVGVVYGRVLAYAIGGAFALFITWQLVERHIGWVRPVLHLQQLYGYALPLGVNLVISLGIGWTDIFLLGLLTNASTVGAYRGCMQIVLVFDLGANAFAAALAPVFTVLIAEGRRARMQDMYTSAVRLQTLMALPFLLVIMVNAADLLRVLGPDFAMGAPALLILGCGQFAKGTLSPATVALIIGGRQKLDAVNVAIAAVANLILNLMLIPFLGLAGAAFATATSLIGLAMVRCLEVRRVFGLRTLDFAPLRAMLVTMPLTLAIWAMSALLGIGPGTGFAALFCRLAIMGMAIGGSIWFFCLEAGDRTMLLRLALRRDSGVPPPTAGVATTGP